MKPKKYDMSKMSDIKRWFEEMEGYLKEANWGRGFVTDGTDKEGREFALEAFFELKKVLINQKVYDQEDTKSHTKKKFVPTSCRMEKDEQS